MREITPTLEPTYKQHLAYQELFNDTTRDLLFGGGAGGGKSWLGCEWLILYCIRYPGTTYFIARKTLKVLKRTTLRTFFKVARYHGLKRDVHFKYNEQAATITFYTGSTIDLLEVKQQPSDPEFEDLGSAEYTAGWIEEAGEVSFGAYDTLKSRIGRHLNDRYGITGKLLVTCNPTKNWLYTTFYKPWKAGALPEGYCFLQSLVDDNPRNESAYKRNLQNITSQVKKQRLLFGNWEYDDDPTAMIEYDAITDLFTNPVERGEPRYIICDAARKGSDKAVIYVFYGWVVVEIVEIAKSGIDVLEDRIEKLAKKHNVPRSRILVDEDGVGGGIIDHLPGVKGFLNGSRPLNGENYEHLKAQCYYKLADRVNDRGIAVPCASEEQQEAITEELEQVKTLDEDKDGPLRIQKKEVTKELIGRSPDHSDTLAMRMYFEIEPKQGGAAVVGRGDKI